MKLRSLLLVLASACAVSAEGNRLLEIKNVYVLPMSGGLDQYLAEQLVANGRHVVVNDPTKAEALITDVVGAPFEDKFKELYPPPPPPPTPEPAKDAKKAEDKSLVALMGSGATAPRTSSFTRGRGNVFLIDRSSHSVVWSTFLRPKTGSPKDMNQAAKDIVDRMDDAMEGIEKAIKKAEEKAAKEAAKMASAPAPVVIAPAPTPAPTPAPAPATPPPAAPAPAPAPAK